MLFKRGHAYVASTVDKGGPHILRQPCGRDRPFELQPASRVRTLARHQGSREVAIGHFELQPASRVHRSVIFADSLLDCLSMDSALLGQRAIQR